MINIYNMDGFSLWQAKNAILGTLPVIQDNLFSFLLVENENPAVESRNRSSSCLVISGATLSQLDTGKRCKIRAGCTVHVSFLGKSLAGYLNTLPLFKEKVTAPCHLSAKQESEVRELFNKMEDVSASGYLYKKELVKVFILRLVHYSMKNDPALNRP